MSNSLETDPVQQNVGPDLDPNCLQRLSTDNTSRVKILSKIYGNTDIWLTLILNDIT